MGIWLNGAQGRVLCETWEQLSEYFEYHTVRDTIRSKNKKRVREIVGKNMSERDTMLEIIDNDPTPAELLQSGNYPGIFPADKESGKLGIDYDALSAFLRRFRADTGKLKQIIKFTKGATYDGRVSLTAEQAYEVLLFSALFAYVHHEPKASDAAKLQEYMQLDEPKALSIMKDIPLLRSETELPSFQKYTEGKPFQLELVTIHNETDDIAAVTLKDSPLRQHLMPGEKLLALTVDGQVAAFIPRICVSRGEALYRDGDHLTATGPESGKQRKPDEIAFFSGSDELGLLEADWEGTWIPTRKLARKPSKSIRWLNGAIQDYGYLYSDGSYEGLRAREAWKEHKLLAFDLSGNGKGVALTADRKAIDENGETLSEDIAAVSCCGGKYILLKMDGSVVTDRDCHKLDSPVRAVCAAKTGYWIATDDKLLYMDQEGKILPHPHKLDEIQRDNTGEKVFGRQTDGVIRPVP